MIRRDLGRRLAVAGSLTDLAAVAGAAVMVVALGLIAGTAVWASPSLSQEGGQVGSNPELLMAFDEGESLAPSEVNGGQLQSFRIVGSDVKQGDGAAQVKFDVSDPSKSWSGVRITREYAEPLDLGGYTKIGLWVKGDGQLHSLILDFSDGQLDGSIWFDFDHQGWRHFVFDLNQFPNRWQIDRLNWSAIKRVFLEFADGAGSLKNKGEVTLDELIIAR